MPSHAPAAKEPAQGVFVPGFPFVSTPGRTDIILRTSDGVDFYVHREILSLVSPVFETMFTLPQAEQPSAVAAVVDVQEASPVLDRALRFFYPCTQLTVDGLDELKEITEILISKYDMQWLIPSVKKHFERYFASDPITVYVYAYMYGWEDLGRAAAKETLKLPLRTSDEDSPEVLKLIPAHVYHQLIRYHYRCGAAAQKTTRDFSWIPWPSYSIAEYRWFTCDSHGCAADSTQQSFAGRYCKVRSWFMEYFVAMGDVLAATPLADVRDASHPQFIRVLKRADGCAYCRDCVSNHLRHFTAVWNARINEVVQGVEWKF
ncbi:hypothetical protein C8R45DRAFT_873986 [Mycena sanguinolenta]|nr:hypothetical protein C8R45DRAFT_873986 [Mycena sanguinolenta]